MSEYTHNGNGKPWIDNEKPWYRRLAAWSADPPSPREYRRHYRGDEMRVWLCEIWHTINKMSDEIERLRSRVAELENKKK